ncbi:hypothetical protein GQX74_004980 [Glossina fuscipes]|nr:hypothetical protein GQX74_004980 [Glossina fuscipes]
MELEPKSLGISNAGSRTLQGKCEVPQKPMLRVDISNKMCTQILGVGTGTGQQQWGFQHDIFEGMIKQLYYDKQRDNIEFAASAKAAPEPTTPTETPQNKLTKPTAKPAPNIT